MKCELASDQSSVSSWNVQPIKELSSTAGWCARRGCVKQLANRPTLIQQEDETGWMTCTMPTLSLLVILSSVHFCCWKWARDVEVQDRDLWPVTFGLQFEARPRPRSYQIFSRPRLHACQNYYIRYSTVYTSLVLNYWGKDSEGFRA